MKRINLLFTGGWDSTFRLCQLSFLPVKVQPVYVCIRGHEDRTNWEKEIQAQDKIISMLRQKKETKATLLDPVRLSADSLPKDAAFEAAFDNWYESGRIPGQLRYLGKLQNLYPELEYCCEGPTLKRRQQGYKKGKLHVFLEEHGFRFKIQKDGSANMDTSKADDELKLLWGGFTFPILGITETDMVIYIKAWGYEDIFRETWTCDYAGDEPCGVCHNCNTKWASGLMSLGVQNLFPPSAVRNHQIQKYLEEHDIDENLRKFLLIGSTSISWLFTDYVGHGYKVVSHINILTLPQNIQNIAYQRQQEQKIRLQAYFDGLIKEWNQKEEVI